jgi:hypothetical protein
MAFRVKFNPGSDEGIEGTDEDLYQFEEHGVLKVEAGPIVTRYSPAFWQWVETKNGHKPGKMRTKKAARPRQIR